MRRILQFRLSTLLIVLAVASAFLRLSTTPTCITSMGVYEPTHHRAMFGCPFTWYSRDWIGPIDGPLQIPEDAHWRFHLWGAAGNVAAIGLVSLVTCRLLKRALAYFPSKKSLPSQFRERSPVQAGISREER